MKPRIDVVALDGFGTNDVVAGGVLEVAEELAVDDVFPVGEDVTVVEDVVTVVSEGETPLKSLGAQKVCVIAAGPNNFKIHACIMGTSCNPFGHSLAGIIGFVELLAFGTSHHWKSQ